MLSNNTRVGRNVSREHGPKVETSQASDGELRLQAPTFGEKPRHSSAGGGRWLRRRRVPAMTAGGQLRLSVARTPVSTRFPPRADTVGPLQLPNETAHAIDPRGDPRLPTPPTEEEKYSYLRGGQKRGVLVFQLLAFAGVAVSLYGFATSSYWTLIFLIPLAVMVVEEVLSFYTSTFRTQVTLADHLATVELWSPARFPAVDIFLPTAGEALDVLNNTMHYIERLDWPGELRVYVLDDAARPEVHQLAERYGNDYIARPGSEFKKAGNLRYGSERSSGEFIVIFDADFVPRTDFLTELMPYFDVATVGIVQSPQYFDTSKSMNWVQRSAGATQELFYRWIQPSRDHHGAAICCGTSAIYRRSAMDAIGGFPRVGHSEDIYTGLELTKIGYRTQYVPVIVSKGVCPDNVDLYIAQQYRWCEGTITMFATSDFHTDESLPLRTRLGFWAGFLYYTSTAMYGFIAPLPAIIMTWFFPRWIRADEILWLSGVMLLWLVVYPVFMRGKWRVEVLRVQVVYGFAHALNIWHMITKHLASWHITGSSKTPPVAVSVRRLYTWYLGLGQILLIVGLLIRTLQYGVGAFWGMIAFSLVNLYIFLPLAWWGLRHRRASGPAFVGTGEETILTKLEANA
jgi:cellulose synthase (UDP-forming)